MPVGIENYVIHVSHEVAQSNIGLGQGGSIHPLLILLEVLSDSSPAILLIFNPLTEIGVV